MGDYLTPMLELDTQGPEITGDTRNYLSLVWHLKLDKFEADRVENYHGDLVYPMY